MNARGHELRRYDDALLDILTNGGEMTNEELSDALAARGWTGDALDVDRIKFRLVIQQRRGRVVATRYRAVEVHSSWR